jgi:uncharacterized protein YodC (DUF2158 family)
MIKNKIKVGDVVKSTSKSDQLMTVNTVNKVECIYFDKNNKLKRKIFNEDELEFVR